MLKNKRNSLRFKQFCRRKSNSLRRKKKKTKESSHRFGTDSYRTNRRKLNLDYHVSINFLVLGQIMTCQLQRFQFIEKYHHLKIIGKRLSHVSKFLKSRKSQPILKEWEEQIIEFCKNSSNKKKERKRAFVQKSKSWLIKEIWNKWIWWKAKKKNLLKNLILSTVHSKGMKCKIHH